MDVGRIAIRKFECEYPIAPNVDFCIVAAITLDEFRGHPADRANFTLTTLLLLGEDNCVSKVGKFDLTVSFDEDVVGFNVTVNDVLSM